MRHFRPLLSTCIISLILSACGGDVKQITGNILFPASTAELEDVTAYVRLWDTTVQDSEATLVAEDVMKLKGASPFAFTLDYGDATIDAGRRYSVTVDVDLDGNGHVNAGDYRSTAMHNVITYDQPKRIDVPVELISAIAPTGATLTIGDKDYSIHGQTASLEQELGVNGYVLKLFVQNDPLCGASDDETGFGVQFQIPDLAAVPLNTALDLSATGLPVNLTPIGVSCYCGSIERVATYSVHGSLTLTQLSAPEGTQAGIATGSLNLTLEGDVPASSGGVFEANSSVTLHWEDFHTPTAVTACGAS